MNITKTRVKEFINYRNIDEQVNKWLEDNQNIEIVDIKYSIGVFQESRSYDSEPCSGVLIIYKDGIKL